MATKIYIAAAGGGAGATTCAVGLGLALAAAGERTLIVDGDARYPAALTVAGCAGLQVYTLEEARRGDCRPKQAIVEHPRSPNLFILPCAGCAEKKYVSAATAEVENFFDYVLCDRAAKDVCDRAAAVCEPYPLSIKGADICLNRLRDERFDDAGLIVNKVNGGLMYDGKIMTPRDIAALLRAPLWGVIPEDLGMPLGSMRADSVKAFRMAAAKMAGGPDRIFSPAKSYAGAGGYIKRKMRSRI